MHGSLFEMRRRARGVANSVCGHCRLCLNPAAPRAQRIAPLVPPSARPEQ